MKNQPSEMLGASRAALGATCARDQYASQASSPAFKPTVSPIIGGLQMTIELCSQLDVELHDLTKILVPVLRPEQLSGTDLDKGTLVPKPPSEGEVMDYIVSAAGKLRSSLDTISAIKSRLLV